MLGRAALTTPSGRYPPDPSERSAGTGGEAKQEIAIARQIRARGLVAGLRPAQIAAAIHEACEPAAGTTWIRAYRLALGISLADVAAQVRAWYETEGRPAPKFSETLLSAYESGQKRPGPEYLHYLCAVYRAEPSDLGFPDHCFCGRAHRVPAQAPAGGGSPGARAALASLARAVPGEPARVPGSGVPGAGASGPGASGPGVSEPGGPGFGVPGRGVSGRGVSGRGVSEPGGPGVGVPEPGVSGPGLQRPGLPPAPAAAFGTASWEDGGARRRAGAPAGLPSPVESAFAAGSGDPRPDFRPAEAEDDDDVLRRMLLRLIVGGRVSVGGEFFGAVDRIRRRMDDALVAGSVSATMLDQWEETSVGYGRQYMTVPPLRLLCDVLLDFGDVRRMAEQRQPLEYGERLCRLAGQLAGLAGMIMIDVGDQRMARSFFRTARTAADETGDRHLRAWVAVREAFVPLYYGVPGEVSTLARAGAGLAGRNPCAAGAMALTLEARALARAASRRDDVGRGQAVRRACLLLGHAHEAFSRLPATERGDTAFGYTERQLLFHEGDTLVGLGDHQGAEKAFTRALELYAPDEVLDRSLIAFGLARCRLEAAEPEEALRISQETVMSVPPEHRAEILMHTARALGDCVEGRHGALQAVREYREALVSA